MFYQKYFGDENHPYCGMDDMKPTVPAKKSDCSNELVTPGNFSRFDYILLEDDRISPQNDSVMCGAWAVLETVLHNMTDSAFTSCTPLFETSDLNPEFEMRTNLCRFTGNFIGLLTKNPKVMFNPMSRSARNTHTFPKELKMGRFNDSTCMGGETRCAPNKMCIDCEQKYQIDLIAKYTVEMKESIRYPGCGLFAKCNIDEETFLCEYKGDIKNRNDVEDTSYVAEMGNGSVIDAVHSLCLAKYINHSCKPNCIFQKITQYTDGENGFVEQLWVVTKEEVIKGEELVVNYDGSDPEKSFSKNFPNGTCLCAVCNPNLGSDKEAVAGSKPRTTSTSSVTSYTTADLYDPPDEEMDLSKTVGVARDPEMDISKAIGVAVGTGTSTSPSSCKANFDTETSL